MQDSHLGHNNVQLERERWEDDSHAISCFSSVWDYALIDAGILPNDGLDSKFQMWDRIQNESYKVLWQSAKPAGHGRVVISGGDPYDSIGFNVVGTYILRGVISGQILEIVTVKVSVHDAVWARFSFKKYCKLIALACGISSWYCMCSRISENGDQGVSSMELVVC